MEFVAMSDSEDWLLRPVLAGVASYLDIKEGRLDLYDLAVLNEALSVKAENERRLYESSTRR